MVFAVLLLPSYPFCASPSCVSSTFLPVCLVLYSLVLFDFRGILSFPLSLSFNNFFVHGACCSTLHILSSGLGICSSLQYVLLHVLKHSCCSSRIQLRTCSHCSIPVFPFLFFFWPWLFVFLSCQSCNSYITSLGICLQHILLGFALIVTVISLLIIAHMSSMFLECSFLKNAVCSSRPPSFCCLFESQPLHSLVTQLLSSLLLFPFAPLVLFLLFHLLLQHCGNKRNSPFIMTWLFFFGVLCPHSLPLQCLGFFSFLLGLV